VLTEDELYYSIDCMYHIKDVAKSIPREDGSYRILVVRWTVCANRRWIILIL
jgi:hypothetical protein